MQSCLIWTRNDCGQKKEKVNHLMASGHGRSQIWKWLRFYWKCGIPFEVKFACLKLYPVEFHIVLFTDSLSMFVFGSWEAPDFWVALSQIWTDLGGYKMNWWPCAFFNICIFEKLFILLRNLMAVCPIFWYIIMW